MGRSDYQKRVLAGLRRLLLDPDGGPKRLGPEGTGERVMVEDARIEDYLEGEMVIVLYRDLLRPECLFGWKMEAQQDEDPEIWTTLVWANFCEHVIGTPYGLPAECREEGITWTG